MHGTSLRPWLLMVAVAAGTRAHRRDVGQTKEQSGLAVTGANFRNDVNLSGTISSSDIIQVKANAGHSVTAPSARAE